MTGPRGRVVAFLTEQLWSTIVNPATQATDSATCYAGTLGRKNNQFEDYWAKMDVTDSILLNPTTDRPVSRGGFCDIYRSSMDDGGVVAINLYKGIGGDYASRRNTLILTWARCNHPNIVPLIGTAMVQGHPAVVREWLEHGDVLEYLRRYPTADRSQLSAKICDGVAYLHANDIVHGDLKGSHILVSGNGVPRIILSDTNTRMVNEMEDEPRAFAVRWAAPELVEHESVRSFQSDVYALGMEITTSEVPYPERRSDYEVVQAIISGKLPSRPIDTIPDNEAGNILWRLLSACWTYNPKERPSAMEISKVMNALVPPTKSSMMFTNEMGVQDIAAFFIQNNVIDYTDELQRRNLQSPYFMTASSMLYKIDLLVKGEDQHTAYTQKVIVKCVMGVSPYKQLKHATRELYLWSRYQHDNILPLLGFAVLNDKLAMISPWIENGSVTEYVKYRQNPDYHGLCTQLSCAIAYLHENGLVHGDIKGDNVLVSDKGIVKVMDFGVSIKAQIQIEFTHTSVGRGTERWQAPEILRRKSDSTKEGDVYALGMTMMEIYTHDRPYGNMDIGHDEKTEIIAGTLRPGRPWRLPFDSRGTAFWELVQRCWVVDPTARPTSDGVYKQLIGT